MAETLTVEPSRRAARAFVALRPFAGLTGTEALARLLSFAFYIVAARALAPAGFGELRYTITLATLAFGPIQVLATAVQRELGAARGRSNEAEVIGTSVVTAGLLLIPTVAVTVLLGEFGATGIARPSGVGLVLVGNAIFTMYYYVARGRGEIGRAAWSYAGASFVQLVAFAIYVALFDPSVGWAVVIFATSAIIPVLIAEVWRPVVRNSTLGLEPRIVAKLWRLALPLALAQCAFLVWQSADQIWVEKTLGSTQVGLYAAAKNLSQLYWILPSAVSGVLMPRAAEMLESGNGAKKAVGLARRAAAISFALTAVAAVLVIPVAGTLLRDVFGQAYGAAKPSLIALSIAMILYAPFSALGSVAVGWGRPGIYSLGMSVAAAVEVLLLVIVPSEKASFAGLAVAIATAAGLLSVIALLVLRPLAGGAKRG